MVFKMIGKDNKSNARAGMIFTERGEIPTPIFMPVATTATVKAVHQRELEKDINAPIILSNTYHLYLRPGLETIEKSGGLHRFNGWTRPILTDSGGYQVYSFSEKRKIEKEGVYFNSHIDGAKHFFTPKFVVDIQRIIGADIMMAFDECTPYPCNYEYAKQSMHLTHQWLDQGVDRFNSTTPKYGYNQDFFPIVQGSIYTDLRKQSAEYIAKKDCVGNAIGGLSVGEPAEEMYKMTSLVCDYLPQDKPRYLMGVGTPANLLECIAMGVDMFDCVMPTRNARNGMLFTSQGIINIKNEKWKNDFSLLDTGLDGYISNFYTKAYLRHLILSKEILGMQIASIQNLTFYLWLMRQAREKILQNQFAFWKSKMIKIVSQRL